MPLFIRRYLPLGGETPQERSQREQAEARTRAVNGTIDEQTMQDSVSSKKYKQAIKVLLLGQSESG